MMKISNYQFNNEEVILDFHEYNNCEFNHCVLVIMGQGPFALNDCKANHSRFKFAGPAANVLKTMATIYQLGDEGKSLIEGAFESIRKGPEPQGENHGPQ